MATVGLKASNGKFVTAEDNVDQAPLRARSDDLLGWQTFDLTYLLPPDNIIVVVTDPPSPKPLAGRPITLKASNGKFVTAECNQTTVPLQARSDQALGWQTFLLVDLPTASGSQAIALMAENRKFVTTEENVDRAPLRARSDQALGWQTFQLIPIAHLEFERGDVFFDKVKDVDEKQDVAWEGKVINKNLKASATQNFTRKIQRTHSVEISFEENLSISYTQNWKFDVANLMGTQHSVTIQGGFKAGQKIIDSAQDEYTFAITLTIPPDTTLDVSCIIWWADDASLGFEQRFWVTGKDGHGKTLQNSEIISYLKNACDFTGKVIDDTQNKERVLVSVRGTITGSFGTRTDLQMG